MKTVLLSAMVYLTATAAWALTPYSAQYDLSWDVGVTLSGTASQMMRRDQDTWRIEQTAKASLGSLNEMSLFRQNAQGQILPLEFVRKTQILGRTKQQQYRFNWNQREVMLDEQRLELEDGVFDPLTLQLELRQALNESRPLKIKLADRGRIREYPIENLGIQRIETPAGAVDAIQLRYVKNESSYTDLWFDPAREHLLVKMLADRDGKVFQLNLRTAELFTRDVTRTATQ